MRCPVRSLPVKECSCHALRVALPVVTKLPCHTQLVQSDSLPARWPARWCTVPPATCRAEGALEVYELPEMRLVLSAGGLLDGAPLLGMPVAGRGADDCDGDGGFPEVSACELRLEAFPPHGTRANAEADAAGAAPHLLATLSDGALLVYRAYLPLQVPHWDRLSSCWAFSVAGLGPMQLSHRHLGRTHCIFELL